MRARRKPAAAQLSGLQEMQLLMGSGWNSITPAEEAELRALWIEIGDEFTERKRAKYGEDFRPWALLMFGSPADCAAGKKSPFELQLEEEEEEEDDEA